LANCSVGLPTEAAFEGWQNGADGGEVARNSFAVAAVFFMKNHLTLLALILSLGDAGAVVRLPEIFSSGMVLQKSPATPVWG
jgi:hypothetical protein